MCLIITIISATVFTVLWGILRHNGGNTKNVFTTMMAFWAAALMWSIDGVAAVLGGEGFFDISHEDTLLGFIIVACGLGLCAVLYLKDYIIEKRQAH